MINFNEEKVYKINVNEEICRCGLSREDHKYTGAAEHNFIPQESLMELQSSYGERDDPPSFQKPIMGCLCFFLGLLGTLAVATILCKAAGVSLW